MKSHSWFWGPGMHKHQLVSESPLGTAQLATTLSGAQRGVPMVTPESVRVPPLGVLLLLPGKDCPGGLCVRKQEVEKFQLCGPC